MVSEGISSADGVEWLSEVDHDGPGDSILVVVAHPDDAEFMVSGTVARWTREGREVNYVLCTNGVKPRQRPDDMISIGCG